MCHVPRSVRAPLRRERLGKNEISVRAIRRAERPATQNGSRRSNVAEHAAHGRSDDEAEPERGASSPNFAARCSGGVTSAMYALAVGKLDDVIPETRDQGRANHRGRERHQQIVDAESEVGEQHHGTPPKAIRERADHGRGEKLHCGPHEAEQPDDPCRVRDIAALELDYELRQTRES